MDKAYYRKYYDFERKHWWFRARAQILRDRLLGLLDSLKPDGHESPALKILNVGAATGFSTALLSEFGDVTSVEYDPDCCRFLQEQLGIDAINASVTDLPFGDDAFDLVCAFDVIEHVEDDGRAVREMYRVCRTEGIIFVTVPAYMDLWSNHDEINHHQRRYVRPQLRRLFSSLDGSVIRDSYFNTILYPPVWLARKFMNLLKRPSGDTQGKSDFEVANNRVVNSFMYWIFTLERPFLKRMDFPFGVSVLLLFRKGQPTKRDAEKKEK